MSLAPLLPWIPKNPNLREMKGFSLLAHYKVEFCKTETKSKLFLTKLNYFQQSQGQVNKNKTNVSLPAHFIFWVRLSFLLFVIGKVGMIKNQQTLLSTPTSILLHSSSMEIHLLDIRLTLRCYFHKVNCFIVYWFPWMFLMHPIFWDISYDTSHFCLRHIKMNQICV